MDKFTMRDSLTNDKTMHFTTNFDPANTDDAYAEFDDCVGVEVFDEDALRDGVVMDRKEVIQLKNFLIKVLEAK